MHKEDPERSSGRFGEPCPRSNLARMDTCTRPLPALELLFRLVDSRDGATARHDKLLR